MITPAHAPVNSFPVNPGLILAKRVNIAVLGRCRTRAQHCVTSMRRPGHTGQAMRQTSINQMA